MMLMDMLGSESKRSGVVVEVMQSEEGVEELYAEAQAVLLEAGTSQAN
jgi:hypothetical protein